ncbi:MAG: hypothetical protein BWY09_02716 [Candidatus Hydrogenedentes bacterium ADurb.Bin179]|nr:MAG: hypothetical protein BWY09_02716 [Candidatus Hydrogenedentes bacterium ADurb.Bin179]
MGVACVLLEQEGSIVINQRESCKHFIFTVIVHVRDGGIMAGRPFIMPQHTPVMGDTPHVPIAILDYQVFAPSPPAQIGEEKTVVRRSG